MGGIHVDVAISGFAEGSRSWTGSFLVDTGAMDSVVPRDRLDAIGITPEAQRVYELADGREVTMDVAGARIEFMGEFTAGLVAFGEPDSEPLLGATALASVGVEVDPRNQRLTKLSAVRLKAVVDEDSERQSFSQRYGYEDIPDVLKREELTDDARLRIENVIIKHFGCEIRTSFALDPKFNHIFQDLYSFMGVSLWQWQEDCFIGLHAFTDRIFVPEFNRVFDRLEVIMRHKLCPSEFTCDINKSFQYSHSAYRVDKNGHIIPVSTEEEGIAILDSLERLDRNGLDGATKHLRNAAQLIRRQEWADSIRESIHAVESVARRADASKTLNLALRSLTKRRVVHSALGDAFIKLYGYTSDEPGIRHALDQKEAQVGANEARFMFGACAVFSGYLWQAHLDATS